MTADALPILAIDFENRSLSSIRELGSRLYAQHPTTQVICACFAWLEPNDLWGGSDLRTLRWVPENAQQAKGPVYGWGSGPGAEWRAWSTFPFGDMAGVEFEALAHNVAFDSRVWERLGWPRPVRWIDTSELARRAGMPAASLEFLSAELLGDTKDLEGNKIMRSLSRPWKARKQTKAQVKRGEPPEPPREFALDPIPADLLLRTVEYCEKDAVLALRLYHEHLQAWDHVSDLEDAILHADRIINERGVHFDSALARKVLEIDAAIAARARADAGVTDPSELRAPARFIASLAELGVYVGSAQKGEIEPLLEHDNPDVAALAAARLSGASIARGKLQAGLVRTSPDDRMRDGFRYFAAGPGRWGGSGFQIQNMPGAR